MAHPGGSEPCPREQGPVGRHAKPEPAAPSATDLRGYEPIVARLTTEFAQEHPAGTIARCVSAARHGAEDLTGSAPLELVESIARKHLQVLTILAAERRQEGGLRNAAT